MENTPNLAIFLTTTENALEKTMQDKIKNLKDSWKEVQAAFQNIKVETGDALFRVRGEAAKRADKIAFWRKVEEHESQYREALSEIEQLKDQLQKIEGELKKIKEEKSIKNQFIKERNEVLLNQLQCETEKKIKLVDDLLDDESEFYKMNYQQRKEHFKKLKDESLEKYKTLQREPSVDSAKKLLTRCVQSEAVQC